MANSKQGKITTVCKIFSHTELENYYLCSLYCDYSPPSRGLSSNINVFYTSLNSTNGYRVLDVYAVMC